MSGVNTAREQGIVRANIYANERERLLPILNANSVDTALKRVAILQESIRAFARRLLPLRALSSVFNGGTLQGTGQVVVPYFPLFATGSTTFVAATGYTGTASINQGAKISVAAPAAHIADGSAASAPHASPARRSGQRRWCRMKRRSALPAWRASASNASTR